MMIRLIQNFQERRLKKRQLADRMNIFASTVHRKNNRRRKNGDLTDPEYVKKINSYLKLHQLAEYYSPKLSKDGKFYFINYNKKNQKVMHSLSIEIMTKNHCATLQVTLR